MKLARIRLFRRRSIWPRAVVQVLFFAIIAIIAINHSLVENGSGIPFLSGASLHALCPFGGVVSLYQLLTTGTMVQKVRDSSFVLMSLVFILAVLFGPVFCGWVCPLGTAQEWVGKLGRRIFKTKRYNHFIPRRLDQILRFARYGVLVWVLYVTITSGKLVFQSYDPYFALFNFWSGEVTITALAILGLALILSLFVERPWCKYACPYGALLGLFNLFRVFKIRRVSATCRECSACTLNCPMNIPVDEKTVVRDHQCISCLECTSEARCPVKDIVVFSSGGVK